MTDPLDFTGKVVLVTGGTKGVGRGIAGVFADAGADVVVCGRREPDGEGPGSFIGCDVRDAGAVDAMVDGIVTEHGRLDVLVNNAGGAPFAEAADASPRFHDKIIALNLTAPLVCAVAAHRVMVSQGDGGSIVNVASVSGTRPSPGTASYGAAKAGLLNLTQTLAVEWAPTIRVNAVTVGLVLTEQAHLHYGDDESIARVAATIPMGRLATPSEVGEACRWLASPAASYVTGASLELHGGNERPAYLSAVTGD